MSLDDNEISDGAVLLLSATEPPAPQQVIGDPAHVVADVASESRPYALRLIPVLGCLVMGGVAATALAWPAVATGGHGHPLIGAGLVVAAAVGAEVARRTDSDPFLCPTLGVLAALFAAVAGFLAVPAGQFAAHAMLASAAAFLVSLLAMRVTHCGTVVLTAIAIFCAVTGCVAAAAVLWRVTISAVGAALAVLALVALSVAPRLTIALTGIGPEPPSADDGVAPVPHDFATRVVRAHRTLTGLVIGTSAAAAFGAAQVAYDGLEDREATPRVVVFTAVIGVVLLLRARTHADATRRLGLAMSGIVCAPACFATIVVAGPQFAHWTAVTAAVIGAAALSAPLGVAVSPAAGRAVELAEYAALAAVLPVACWAGGGYALVRAAGLL